MSLLERAAAIVGAGNVLSGAEDVQPFVNDWRKRYRGRPLAVARPGSTAQVAALVQLCAETGTSIVPQGGNTSLCGASVPDASGQQLVISLVRMNKVRAVDALNNTMTVEAGCILANVQKAADQVGRLFPLSLGGEGSAVIGGNLSTNAGGTGVLRYGNTRVAIAQHTGAASIGGQIATDHRRAFTPQTERKQPTDLVGSLLHIGQNAAGLHRHGVVERIHRPHLVHAHQTDHQLLTAGIGHRGTAQTGVAALGHDAGAGLGAQLHQRRHLGRAARSCHGQRPAAIALAPIIDERLHIFSATQHIAGTDDGCGSLEQTHARAPETARAARIAAMVAG